MRPAVTLAAQLQRPRRHRPFEIAPSGRSRGVLPAISPRALPDTDLALPIGVLIRLAPDEPHLRRLLRDYVDYYNADRVHTELRDSPAGRQIERRPSVKASVIGSPRVGGLHHRYIWREAA